MLHQEGPGSECHLIFGMLPLQMLTLTQVILYQIVALCFNSKFMNILWTWYNFLHEQLSGNPDCNHHYLVTLWRFLIASPTDTRQIATCSEVGIFTVRDSTHVMIYWCNGCKGCILVVVGTVNLLLASRMVIYWAVSWWRTLCAKWLLITCLHWDISRSVESGSNC